MLDPSLQTFRRFPGLQAKPSGGIGYPTPLNLKRMLGAGESI